jgi:hypothetical protein
MVVDPGALSLDTFAPLVGESFAISVPARPAIEMPLKEAVALADQPTIGDRLPSSLVFGGAGGRILPQGIYQIEHPALGSVELFLVPLEPDGEGPCHQAVFS